MKLLIGKVLLLGNSLFLDDHLDHPHLNNITSSASLLGCYKVVAQVARMISIIAVIPGAVSAGRPGLEDCSSGDLSLTAGGFGLFCNNPNHGENYSNDPWIIELFFIGKIR